VAEVDVYLVSDQFASVGSGTQPIFRFWPKQMNWLVSTSFGLKHAEVGDIRSEIDFC